MNTFKWALCCTLEIRSHFIRNLYIPFKEYSADIQTDHGIQHETIKVTDKETQIESENMIMIRDYRAVSDIA